MTRIESRGAAIDSSIASVTLAIRRRLASGTRPSISVISTMGMASLRDADRHRSEVLHGEAHALTDLERMGCGRAAGEHDPARLEPAERAAGKARRRHQRARRIAEDRGGRADLDRPAVDLHHEAEVGDVLIGPR